MKEPRDKVITLRTTTNLHQKLHEYAKTRGISVSDLVRVTMLSLIQKPMGWQCSHISITGKEGSIISFDCWHGCAMLPVHEPIILEIQ